MDEAQSTTDQPPGRQTVFLISNLHCPSCISHIEHAIFSLRSEPSFVSHSLILRTVTVHHPSSLPVVAIVEALDHAGYEVYSHMQESSSAGGPSSNVAIEQQDHDTPKQLFTRAVQRWWSGGDQTEEEARKRMSHIEK